MSYGLRAFGLASCRHSAHLGLMAVCVLTTACGSSDDETGTNAPAVSVNSCATLAGANPGELLGEPVSEPTSFFDIDNDDGSASQCAVFAESSGRQVTLFLMYSSRITAPRNRDEFIEGQVSNDVLGMGEETANALRAGREIPGLGDIAFTYDLLGFNLMTFWGEHYQLTLTLAGFENDDAASEIATTLAERVISSI